MRTSNPVLNPRAFDAVRGNTSGSDVMTLDGTVNKSLLSILISLLAAAWTWNDPSMIRFYLPLIIISFVIAIVLAFKPAWSPILVPVYAALYGAALGSVSILIDTTYPGIVPQAVGLTFGVALAMLGAYKSGLIKVTDTFRSCIVAATAGIAIFYLITFVLSLFGVSMAFMNGSGAFSIGLSLVIVGVAALNLVLDFDFIAQASNSRSTPKYMEWYGAFGLLVTMIWLYWEILRLLIKLKSSKD